jgi:hypothetical protein
MGSCTPLSHGPRADLPYKNRADLPDNHELRATVTAALFLRVSNWNNFFFNLILWNTISIWNSNAITLEQVINIYLLQNYFIWKPWSLHLHGLLPLLINKADLQDTVN